MLVIFSFYLGMHRIFQVDEVQNAFQARLFATGKAAQYGLGAPFFLLGPLTWLAGAAGSGVDVLVWLRLPFVALMWLNAVLLVKGAGFRLRSREGLGTLLLAATLAPMWDYGFEIRHDVLLLTGILTLWCLVREERLSLAVRFGLLGCLGALLQFIAFKSFIFSLPLLVILGLRARARAPRAWLGQGLALGCGLALGLLAGRGATALAGVWPAFHADQGVSVRSALQVQRFSCWSTLLRLLGEAPLLAYAGLAALLAPMIPKGGFRLAGFADRPGTPEWIFALAALAALLANPTPFAYNLILLVPPFFILVAAHRQALLDALAGCTAQTGRLCITFLLLLHGVPWAVATWRHLAMGNDGQRQVIRVAEAMTDPARDRVFDGSGLVATRDPIGYNWLVHGLTLANFANGVWPTVRASLAANPTPVVLPSYRLEMLPEQDKDFIKAHYLALAPDFMVLGGILESGSTRWTCLATGRYQFDLHASQGAGPLPLTLDGAAAGTGVHLLGKGEHLFQVPPGDRLVVVWLGPNLPRIPLMAQDQRPLFVNWY
jgi:hypothetical protein